MKVDAHVHVWPAGSNIDHTTTFAAAGSMDALAVALLDCGVEAAVLIQPAVLGLDHSYLLSSLHSRTLRAVGIAQADPQDKRTVEVIAEVTKDVDIAGFRLPLLRAENSWLEREAAEFWTLATTRGTVVSLLLNPNQLSSVEELAAAYPHVPVVIDHLARFDLSHDHVDAINRLCGLSSLSNIYVKASALGALGNGAWPYRDIWPALLAVIDAFGTRRVMWGSDYPFILASGPYADSFRAVEAALHEHGLEGVDDILGANALGLFFERTAQSG